jgi:hypothetical protein
MYGFLQRPMSVFRNRSGGGYQFSEPFGVVEDVGDHASRSADDLEVPEWDWLVLLLIVYIALSLDFWGLFCSILRDVLFSRSVLLKASNLKL